MDRDYITKYFDDGSALQNVLLDFEERLSNLEGGEAPEDDAEPAKPRRKRKAKE